MAEAHILRFAVGAFDDWTDLDRGIKDLRRRGFVPDRCSCLALERTFAGTALPHGLRPVTAIRQLAFPNGRGAFACTSGPLADCLADRLRLGATTLDDALRSWLLPRHAAHFQELVETGKILLWVLLADAEDERRACQSLLIHSSDAVGVHDLGAPQ
ncbi:MAG TPA: hypothetical protein VNK52_09890 [Hyphomicrobiaceae bacterium]|nr:hypothetical protein [Hyphomicrobiaceae bacterium]